MTANVPPLIPEEPTPDEFDNALAAGFAQTGSTLGSVLDSLPGLAGTSRVLLRDEAKHGSPVVRAGAGARVRRPRGRGHYHMLGEIARGGMAVVMKGHDVDLGRDVAMKIIGDDLAQKPAVLQRFVEEAQIGGQLQHPGIVPVYELGVLADDKPYFTMKLIMGRTLATLLESNEERARLLSVFEAVSQTMAYAHSRGVIHRDLKPSNIMVGSFGEVHVVDWGLAKVLARGGIAEEGVSGSEAPAINTIRSGPESTGSGSIAGSVLGTPAYMPPEQATGDVEAMDERSDVFSLGAILCEILTGKPPYVGTTGEMLALAAACDTADAIARLDESHADAELVELAKQCLSELPSLRPRSAEAVAKRMAAYVVGVEERARSAQLAAAAERIKATEARKAQRLTLALAASVLVTILLAGAGYLWVESERSQRRALAATAANEAIQDAERLFGQAQNAGVENLALWVRARSAIERAERSVEKLETGRPQLMRKLVREFTAAEALAQEEAQRAERNAALVEQLEAISVSEDSELVLADYEENEARQRHLEYRLAFEDYGIDIDGDPERAAEFIRESGIVRELGLALEDWASQRRKLGLEAWQRPLQVALAADPDPWRKRIYDIYLAEGDVSLTEALKLLDDIDVERLSASTADRLIRVLEFVDTKGLAISIADRALLVHPADFNLAFTCANLFDREELWVRAVCAYRAALALRPEHRESLHRLGETYRRIDRQRDALRMFDRMIELEPDEGHWHYHRGTVLNEGSLAVPMDLEGSLAAFEEAVRLEPDSALFQYHRAWMLGALQRVEEAVQAFEICLELEPEYPLVHTRLAHNLLQLGEIDRAFELLDRALELDENDARAHMNLGMAYSMREDYERAATSFEKALSLAPGDSEVLGNYASYLGMSGGDSTRIKLLLEQSIELVPSAIGYNNLAQAYASEGNFEEAMRLLERGLELDPDHPQCLMNLGQVLMLRGRYRESLAYLERGLEMSPDNAPWIAPVAFAAERVRALSKQEPAFLALLGGGEISDLGECDGALNMARERELWLACAKLYVRRLEHDPDPKGNLLRRHRYRAACVALMAAAGEGDDAAELTTEVRSSWFERAMTWLETDVAMWKDRVATGKKLDRKRAARIVEQFQEDDPLSRFLDEDGLDWVVEADRERCQLLLRELDELAKQTQQD